MQIAWFSPFPPVRTGIAACSADLVGALRQRGHAIDPYPAGSAHDFPWRHRQRPYDLIVYQFGNSSHHDYQWAYALRYPGLVVLHDTRLHHARAAFLLREGRVADYRAEFQWSHPHVPADAAELAIAGLDSRLFYDWSMTRALVETARLVAVHGHLAIGPSGDRAIDDKVVPIRLGHGERVTDERKRTARRRIRATYGIADDAVLFGVFGGLTPEKRIPQVLAAFTAILPHASGARLLLAGAAAAHYDAQADIAARGLTDRVIVTGYLETDDELTDHLAACDVSLNLRWPTAGETSGAWLRALAAGVATVITDLAHLGDVPSLDPRTWTKNEGVGDLCCVAIDILDEDHSLRLAMRRLAQDAALRETLGRAGQAWWEREHSLEAMVEDYVRLIDSAAGRPAEARNAGEGGPDHLRPDGDAQLRALLRPFAIESPLTPPP
jgi:glycosyltransferase involved in cell wall biosynthesis